MNNYSISQSGQQHLSIFAPGSSLFTTFLVVSLPLIFLMFWGVVRLADKQARDLQAKYPQFKTDDSARVRRGMYRYVLPSVLAGALFFWGIGYTSASLVLDKPANTATMHVKMTAFLPSQERTIPLSSVSGAVLDYKPNARRIRLTTNGGEDLAFPMWTSRGGQKEAVDAINAFLQRPDH